MFWGSENGVPQISRGIENGVPEVPAGTPRRCGVSGFCWGFWVSVRGDECNMFLVHGDE